MSAEGALSLTLRVEDERVAQVQLVSTRRTDVSRVLQGKPVAEALALVPSLFSVCATAHRVAATEAIEAAQGVEVPETQRLVRLVACALEAIDNHVFQMCVEWPQRLGDAPAVDALRRVRGATQALRDTLLTARGHGLVDAVRTSVQALVPDTTNDEALRRKWLAARVSPVAAFLEQVQRDEDLGVGRVQLLPMLSATWFHQHLTTSSFAAFPTLDGVPAEAGALALLEHDVTPRTTLARLFAKVEHLQRLVSDVEAATQALQQLALVPHETGAPTISASGTGIADTARGRLAHSVELEQGKVVVWRTVAPTEWSFHPRGVLQELTQASTHHLERRVGWLVAALDPCVPCSVHLEVAGARHA